MQGLAIVRPIIFERPNARSFSFSSYTHKNLVLTVLLWDTVPLCVMWSDLSLNSVLSALTPAKASNLDSLYCGLSELFLVGLFHIDIVPDDSARQKQLRTRKLIFLIFITFVLIIFLIKLFYT